MLKAGPVTNLAITKEDDKVFFDKADSLSLTVNGDLVGFDIIPDVEDVEARAADLAKLSKHPAVFDCKVILEQGGIQYQARGFCSYSDIDSFSVRVSADSVVVVS